MKKYFISILAILVLPSCTISVSTISSESSSDNTSSSMGAPGEKETIINNIKSLKNYELEATTYGVGIFDAIDDDKNVYDTKIETIYQEKYELTERYVKTTTLNYKMNYIYSISKFAEFAHKTVDEYLNDLLENYDDTYYTLEVDRDHDKLIYTSDRLQAQSIEDYGREEPAEHYYEYYSDKQLYSSSFYGVSSEGCINPYGTLEDWINIAVIEKGTFDTSTNTYSYTFTDEDRRTHGIYNNIALSASVVVENGYPVSFHYDLDPNFSVLTSTVREAAYYVDFTIKNVNGVSLANINPSSIRKSGYFAKYNNYFNDGCGHRRYLDNNHQVISDFEEHDYDSTHRVCKKCGHVEDVYDHYKDSIIEGSLIYHDDELDSSFYGLIGYVSSKGEYYDAHLDPEGTLWRYAAMIYIPDSLRDYKSSNGSDISYMYYPNHKVLDVLKLVDTTNVDSTSCIALRKYVYNHYTNVDLDIEDENEFFDHIDETTAGLTPAYTCYCYRVTTNHTDVRVTKTTVSSTQNDYSYDCASCGTHITTMSEVYMPA